MLISFCPKARVESIAQSVAEQVEGEDEAEDGERDESHFPPDALPEPHACIVDHDTPRRLIRHTDTKKTHDHFRADRRRKAQRKSDDDDMKNIRQNVTE